MKGSIFKYACVFIITMYCLAPLSAIDLNQDNNTKYINHEDNESIVAVEDVNITAEDIDKETEILDNVNDTDSPDSKSGSKVDDSDVEGNGCDKDISVDVDVEDNGSAKDIAVDVDVECNGSNGHISDSDINESNQELNSRFPDLYGIITDTVYGENPDLVIGADNDLKGRLSITCPDFENSYKVPIEDGYMRYRLHENLPPGKYYVKIAYAGDSTFEPQEITLSFNVFKANPNLRVDDIGKVSYGEKVNVNIHALEIFNETVKVKVNSEVIPVKITNGKGSVSLDNLTPGEYQMEVVYDGDVNFDPYRLQKSFFVLGDSNPNLSVDVDDIGYGEHPVIKVHANESLTDSVRITSPQFDTSYEATIQDGYLEYELPEDFDMGNYTIKVNYDGGEVFGPKEASTTFNVNRGNPNLSMDVDDCSLSDTNLHAVIHADERFTGNVTLKINGRVYVNQVEVVDGYGEGYYPRDHFPGNYTVVASTEGNDHFNAGKCSTTYIVKDS